MFCLFDVLTAIITQIILKIVTECSQINYTKPMLNAMGCIRILILYLTFCFNFLFKRNIISFFYRENIEIPENQAEVGIGNTLVSQRQEKTFNNNLDKNKINNNNEMVILNNVSPIKTSQIKTPRRYSLLMKFKTSCLYFCVKKLKFQNLLRRMSIPTK